MKRLFAAALGIATLSVLSLQAGWASESARSIYPARPLTIIVPFAAGGPTDIVTRLVAARISMELGQQISVENIPGAGGSVAALHVKRAEPDGYTLIMGHLGTHAAIVGAMPDIYDPAEDFVAVGLAVRLPVLVVARKDLPARTLEEFTAYARDHAVTMAHAGYGSVSFTTCALLNSLLKIKPKTLAFNGTQPAMEALYAGRVDYFCDQMPSVVGPAQAGKARTYLITTPKRSPLLPNTPTASEAGLPAFDAHSWMGLFAPRNTPPAIVDRLNAALAQALDDPELQSSLSEHGAEIPPQEQRTSAYFAQFVRDEAGRWPAIVRAALSIR